ncbi:hypothetical protein LCGC14_1025300 [marine sediment metagenome]|uniref:Uncharacterized protein n=1 Tax=marine sediment metagenome TaxID=412755 RepID=A0A0F9MW65_9ZZZZ
MRTIDEKQIKKIKNFIFKNGRLLERTLFSFFFENGTKDAVIKALVAYQNIDGGFGNGIEPDILCPDSTGIGAETALYILDILDLSNSDIVTNIAEWVVNSLNSEGYIDHPPENLENYPYQPWWKNPDNLRIFAIAAFLKKFGFKDKNFFSKVKTFFVKTEIPEEIQIYDYPYFLYLKYLGENKEEKKMLKHIINQFPRFFEKNKEQYPLFGRHWNHGFDIVDKTLIKNEVDNFFNGFKDDGGLKIIYQDLPWWRPIWTLDCLIQLKKSGMIAIIR